MDRQTKKEKSLGVLGKYKLLVKDSFFFGGLNAFSKFFSIFLTPLLTRLLSKDQYGSIDILNPIIGIAATIVIFGMDSAVGRFFYYDENADYRKKVTSNGFWVQMCIALLVSSVLFFSAEHILRFYLGNSFHPNQIAYLRIIALLVFFLTPLKYAQNLLIWAYRRREYLILSMGYITMNFLSIFCSVYFFDDKVHAFFIGQIMPAFLFAILALFFISKNILFTIDKLVLKKMLKYGAPLVVVALIPALVPSLDRYFVNRFLGLKDVAIYGLGFRLATLVAIPIMSLNTALGPFIYAQYKEHNAGKLFNSLINLIIILVTIFIIGVVLLSPVLISFFATREYFESRIVIVPLSFYFLIDMLKSISAVGIDLSLKTYWNLVLYPISLIVLYALLMILTSRYGILGTSIALAASAMFNFLLFSFIGMKLYPFDFSLAKKFFLILFCCLFSGLVQWVADAYNYVAGLILFFLFLIFAYYIIFPNEDRARLQLLLKSKRNRKNED